MSAAEIIADLVRAGVDAELVGRVAAALAERVPMPASERHPYTPRHPGEQHTPVLPQREWLPLRWSVLERDNFVCEYCGYQNERGDKMCADHVVPLSRGGTNLPSNLVACCLPCNSSKNDRLLSEWRGRSQ